MAATIGKSGSVSLSSISLAEEGNPVGYADSWTLNPTIDLIDITAYGATFRSRESGLRDWSGSVTCCLDRSDSGQLTILNRVESGTDDLYLRFKTSSIAYWGGKALPTGFAVNSNVADKIAVTFNFQGNGVLSYTSAAS